MKYLQSRHILRTRLYYCKCSDIQGRLGPALGDLCPLGWKPRMVVWKIHHCTIADNITQWPIINYYYYIISSSSSIIITIINSSSNSPSVTLKLSKKRSSRRIKATQSCNKQIIHINSVGIMLARRIGPMDY